MIRKFIITVIVFLLASCISQTQPNDEVNTNSSDNEKIVRVVFDFSYSSTTSADPPDRFVAFHSITLIDQNAYPLDQIILGTKQAISQECGGWVINETPNDSDEFQWTGGESEQACLRLTLPKNTNGLLLNMKSLEKNINMEVHIDGEFAGSLPVGENWHTGYIPLRGTNPATITTSEPQWSNERYFPRFSETDRIFVFPAKTVLDDHNASWVKDWRIDQSYDTMMALTLVGMQGVINRNGPHVYLDYQNSIDLDRYWIPYLQEYTEVIELDLEPLSTIAFLLNHYGELFDGAVIYDPAVPDTINVATMIAGLENRIILAPEQLELPGIPEFESKIDLRELVQENDWDTSEESKYRIYQWVYENLWSGLDHRIIGAISPGPPTSQSCGVGEYFPLSLYPRDYLIALKLPALWLDPSDPQQNELYAKYLAESPSPIPITGPSPLEGPSGALATEFGNWSAGLSTGNFTVWSGVRPEIVQYDPNIDEETILSTLGNKPVAMIWSSDGDNLYVQMARGFHGVEWVWDQVHGPPFGWTINPTLVDMAPVLWNYYMDTSENTEFVCGYSGAGYIYPQRMNESKLQAYIEETATYLDVTGLRTIHVWTDRPWNKRIAELYYEGLKDTDILGFIAGSWAPNWGIHFSYEGAPKPALRVPYVVEPSNLDQIVHEIMNRNPNQFLLELDTYNWHQGEVIQDNQTETGKALFFSDPSDELREILSGPYINLEPGEYTANFRLKTNDNQSTRDFIHISITSPTLVGLDAHIDGWTTYATKVVSPNQFAESNQYEVISVPFKIESLTSNLEIIVQHRGSEADLTADYISITKSDPAELPIFAPVFILVTSAELQTETPRIFIEKFEDQGGIILTPNEFMAALNPEYMIQISTSYLGEEHPANQDAQDFLDEGAYFDSLITIRKALSEATEVTN